MRVNGVQTINQTVVFPHEDGVESRQGRLLAGAPVTSSNKRIYQISTQSHSARRFIFDDKALSLSH